MGRSPCLCNATYKDGSVVISSTTRGGVILTYDIYSGCNRHCMLQIPEYRKRLEGRSNTKFFSSLGVSIPLSIFGNLFLRSKGIKIHLITYLEACVHASVLLQPGSVYSTDIPAVVRDPGNAAFCWKLRSGPEGLCGIYGCKKLA
ncbi:hypothetical protein AXG93_1823s1000 [Marchantia polymorpha subsp. ruderalis]|uniref:Uncharacterized protein n=1 Tax=Marchantia polymorpha subsp. ruderalis TaxID=1480154 RepID=A0A176VWI4_MARPO|nr:hypothetical protein AXG93_1823s1000 [Marchantia polymorpha subsp. ruderalis]